VRCGVNKGASKRDASSAIVSLKKLRAGSAGNSQ
jgi:hypothetical protein